jgi:hypothetical protein
VEIYPLNNHMTNSFRTWLELQNVQMAPQIRATNLAAIRAASNAVQQKKNPLMAAKQQVLQAAQKGTIGSKDLGKLIPQDDDDQQGMMGPTA